MFEFFVAQLGAKFEDQHPMPPYPQKVVENYAVVPLKVSSCAGSAQLPRPSPSIQEFNSFSSLKDLSHEFEFETLLVEIS